MRKLRRHPASGWRSFSGSSYRYPGAASLLQIYKKDAEKENLIVLKRVLPGLPAAQHPLPQVNFPQVHVGVLHLLVCSQGSFVIDTVEEEVGELP